MLKSSTLKACFDELVETDGDDECIAWLEKIVEAKVELGHFVAERRGKGRATRYMGFLKGSFNFAFRYQFDDDGPDAIIRFPQPGPTKSELRDEKVRNEVQVMKFLREKTTIPVPRIHSWGTSEESPQQFGPFIIMDFVDGVLLSNLLRKPTDDPHDQVLDPAIEDSTMDTVYQQIADYLLQLSRISFDSIGAISKQSGGQWCVTERPLTYNMNELASVIDYPVGVFPSTPFSSARDYLRWLLGEHQRHLRTQRNFSDTAEIARARFIARHRLTRLLEKYYSDDKGPFTLFCDDLRPSNMLIDPDTLKITAVLDFEFTNAMPAQFSCDPPWWLLLSGPEEWLERDAIDEFRVLYESRMEQFLKAMDREEARRGTTGERLSTQMRESWMSGRFWFDYAMRRSFELDVVYWSALHEDVKGVEFVEAEMEDDIAVFITWSMEQLSKYKADHAARFGPRQITE